MKKQPQTSPEVSMESLVRETGKVFKHASVPKKAALAAAGLALAGTAPYWGPPVWRSKTVRRWAKVGADYALNTWFK